MDWKTISSEYLFKEDWFTIRKDVCERPDGTIINPYYVYEFPAWVAALAITEDGQVVMVRQYRHGIGETILEIPGGCMDDTDPSPEEAVKRELLEETGYSFSKCEYLGKVSPNPSTNNNLLYMFLATGGKLEKEQELDHQEDIEVHLMSLNELKTLLRENKIIQSLHATVIFYALMKLKEIDL